MLELFDLGFSEVLLPVLFWVVLLTVLVIAAAIATMVVGAKQLRKSGRSSFAFCLILVVTHLVVLPLLTIVLATSFSLSRSVANLLERGGQSLVAWSFDMGHDALQEHFQPLDQQSQIAVESVHSYTKQQIIGLESPKNNGIVLFEEGIVNRLTRSLRLAFWKGTEVFILELAEDVSSLSWDDWVSSTQERIAQAIRNFCTPTIDSLRAVAWISLAILGGSVFFFFGVVWAVLHISTRQRPSSTIDRATKQESEKDLSEPRINTFRLTTERQTIDMADILNHLQRDLSCYEYSLFGSIGTGIKAKKSVFSGAVITKVGNFVSVKPRPVDLLPAMLDSVLFGLPSHLAGGQIVVKKVLTCIEKKFR